MSEPRFKVGDKVRCIADELGLDANGRAPRLDEKYVVGRAEDSFVFPEGFCDGWLEGFFEKVAEAPAQKKNALQPGQRVVCIASVGMEGYLENGREYEVQTVTENGGTITVKGGGSYAANRFALLRKMEPTVFGVKWLGSGIDYQKRYRDEREKMEEVDRALSSPKLDGPWGRVGRIQKLHRLLETAESDKAALHRELVASRTLRETAEREAREARSVSIINPMYVRELEAKAAEHQRMKRQLELTESYNFDRQGLTDDEALRDLTNYALKGLGKEPLSFYDWTARRLGQAMKKAFNKPLFWKTPVFNDTFERYFHLSMPLQYIPVSFIIADTLKESK